VNAVTEPLVSAAAPFPSTELVCLYALPSRASYCRPSIPTGGYRQWISLLPGTLRGQRASLAGAPFSGRPASLCLTPGSPVEGLKVSGLSHSPLSKDALVR